MCAQRLRSLLGVEANGRRTKIRDVWWRDYGLPIVMVAAAIVTLVAVARRPDAGTTDFKTFYESSRQYLAHTDPYVPYDANRGPNLNPPWVVALMAQLCRAPLPVAAGLWWVFSFVCFFTAIVLIARAAAPGHAVAIASCVLVTQAAYANLRLGQVAWPLMLFITGAWLADRSRRPVLCGVLIGAAAAWKPFLLVFAPYLLWRREWRAFSAMMATIGVTVVAGLLAVGVGGYSSWLAVLRLVGWAGHPLNASLRGLLTRLLTVPTLSEQPTTPVIVAPEWLDPAWFIAAAVVIAVGARQIVVMRSVDVAWAALTLIALLVSPLGWIHYVPLATGPLVAVLVVGRSDAMRLAAVGVALLCVPFAWLKATTFGPALTLTFASSYTWGLLLLLASTINATRGASPKS
jgi:alpha-1,2-mannosyltransferase